MSFYNKNLTIISPIFSFHLKKKKTILKRTYESHFTDSFINIKDFIDAWTDDIKKDDVIKFVNYIDANMLFIPVTKEDGKTKISRKVYYCSECKKWLKICDSIKNIKQHASLHVSTIFKKETQGKTDISTDKQKKVFIKNIVAFVLFENNSFKSIESSFLKNISNDIPNRQQLTKILTKVANFTRGEIKNTLLNSTANYLTFDEWTDSRNRSYLGITIRSYIDKKYHDFFLDLIYLYSEINCANLLSTEIKKSLKMYGLLIEDITSCTTDNCSLMVATGDKLLIWRIPCVLHIFNNVFKVFVSSIKTTISPIFDLITFLSSSSKYQNFLDRKLENGTKIHKVPSYTEVRWTSFCNCIITLFETKDYIEEFFGVKKFLDQKQIYYLSLLQRICKNFKNVVLLYEQDSFAAISYFLVDIKNLNYLFTELETTEFSSGAKKAKEKIQEYKNIFFYFWDVIAPISVLLNPKIEDYRLLLTDKQVEAAKNEIARRMTNYSNQDDTSESSESDQEIIDRLTPFKSKETTSIVRQSPLVNLLENRNHHIKDLKDFWEKKKGTVDNQIALVALEVLGALVTSVMSERSFSKGRYVLNEHRTNLSTENARDHLLIKCNREIAMKCIDVMNIFDDD